MAMQFFIMVFSKSLGENGSPITSLAPALNISPFFRFEYRYADYNYFGINLE